MSIKLVTISGVNGTDELFQLSVPYVLGTLQVIQRDTIGNKTTLEHSELSDTFFRISPAPILNADLLCYYQESVADVIGLDTLSNWEKANITALVAIIAYQSQTIENMQTAISNRMTYNDFNSYVQVLERQILDLKESALK